LARFPALSLPGRESGARPGDRRWGFPERNPAASAPEYFSEEIMVKNRAWNRLAGTFLVFLAIQLVNAAAGWAEKASRAGGDFVEPAGRLTLSAALEAAFNNHPSLKSAAREIEAREGAAIQAALPGNPTFFVELEEFGGTGPYSGTEAMASSIGVSQEIPLGGKISKRLLVAEKERDFARLELQEAVLNLRGQVKKKFLRVYALERMAAMERSNLALVEESFAVISRLVSVGEISPLDAKKAAMEQALARMALARSQRELEAARVDLAATWGSHQPRFEGVEPPETSSDSVQSFSEEDLWALARDNPLIRKDRIRIDRLKSAWELAKAEAWPDLEVEGGVKEFNESGDQAYFLGISIPVPFFNRNRGGIIEARGNLHKGESELDSTMLSVRAELQSLLSRLEILDSELARGRETILPLAEETYSALQRAYRAGEKGHLELLDAQRMLLEVRRDFLQLETERHDLLADLETLVGRDLGFRVASAGHPSSEKE
jgi:cobalt-zinc-cadmium efflux system outer membrane protein